MNQQFFSPCPRGLETPLSEELKALGAEGIHITDGGVHFSGPGSLSYKVNLHSRTASRVLWRVAKARYTTEQDIYDTVHALPWKEWFDETLTIRVNMAAIKCPLRSLDFATLKIKDAICDKFREITGERPSVNTHAPDIRIHAFLDEIQMSLYVDTSGDALFKRGVRQYTNIAPLRENLAAGILILSGWKPGTPLLDPMCGSGTFLIEAAQMSLNIAPGIGRHFAFEKLHTFNAEKWRSHRRAKGYNSAPHLWQRLVWRRIKSCPSESGKRRFARCRIS
jgi:putative N6-adenine-specific DNA methylase